MATRHQLKTWPDPFEAIWRGYMTHSVRRADRDFRAGDVLELLEYEPRPRVGDNYTGRMMEVAVTFVSAPGSFGLPDEICVMSIHVLTRRPT